MAKRGAVAATIMTIRMPGRIITIRRTGALG